jgi:hypothetical protein
MSRAAALALALSTLLCAGGSCAQVSDVGFIAEVRGRWEIVRGTPAKAVSVLRGLSVSENDRLRKVGDEATAFVVVAFYTGEIQKLTVDQTLQPRQRPALPSRLVRAIQARFQGGFVSAAVRGGARLSDGVVRAESGGTDLAAVFADMDDGLYTLTAYALDSQGSVIGSAVTTGRVEAGKNTRGPALAPGIYQLDVADGRGRAVGAAWVRSIEPERFAEAAAEMQIFSSHSNDPDPDVRAVARTVGRACLLSLDDRAQR